MFLHGEDSVADNLSPYIDAAPLEEQKYFLATQQVDEARHAVFFARFMREVLEYDSATMGESLAPPSPSSPGAFATCSHSWTAPRTSCAVTAPSPSWQRRWRCITSSSRPPWPRPGSTSSPTTSSATP